MQTLILFAIVAFLFVMGKKKTAAPQPSSSSQVPQTYLDAVSAIIQAGRDSAAIVNYGSSQGVPEGQVFPSADPGDNIEANPSSIQKMTRSGRRVTVGAQTIGAASGNRVSVKVPSAREKSVKTRRQGSAVVPYSPFARLSANDLVSMIRGN